jgi:hypothetical protein
VGLLELASVGLDAIPEELEGRGGGSDGHGSEAVAALPPYPYIIQPHLLECKPPLGLNEMVPYEHGQRRVRSMRSHNPEPP